MSRFSNLSDWLAWMENLHSVEIDLGLERIYEVACALKIVERASDISHDYSGSLSLPSVTVFTVAGTNGKGTCTSTLAAGLLSQNVSVGTYTSPHFYHYAERICIDGQPVDDALICQAFAAIDQARGDISLSYFEFGTLAALWIFVQQKIDYVVLEVGLGGRLDAVNIIDADVAIITSIDIDHQEWLGNDRDTIAKEKLGIARLGRPLIISEPVLTPALEDAADIYPSRVINRDFVVEKLSVGSILVYGTKRVPLNLAGLHPHSVSAALVALAEVDLLPDNEVLSDCLTSLSIMGRCEHIKVNGIKVIFDVAHNPAAVRALKVYLQSLSFTGQTLFVMAIMADKDYEQVIDLLSGETSQWFVGNLNHNPRALSAGVLAKALADKQQKVSRYDAIEQAFDNALTQATPHDRIVVLGSFFTVAAIKGPIQSLETDLIGRKV